MNVALAFFGNEYSITSKIYQGEKLTCKICTECGKLGL